MSEELTQEAVDAAIILENKVRERVQQEVNYVVGELVEAEVHRLMTQQKTVMLMEITTAINQMLRSFVEEERKPLWESTAAELGLDPKDLNTHMLGRRGDEDAVRE